jgi:hypothetical protein
VDMLTLQLTPKARATSLISIKCLNWLHNSLRIKDLMKQIYVDLVTNLLLTCICLIWSPILLFNVFSPCRGLQESVKSLLCSFSHLLLTYYCIDMQTPSLTQIFTIV